MSYYLVKAETILIGDPDGDVTLTINGVKQGGVKVTVVELVQRGTTENLVRDSETKEIRKRSILHRVRGDDGVVRVSYVSDEYINAAKDLEVGKHGVHEGRKCVLLDPEEREVIKELVKEQRGIGPKVPKAHAYKRAKKQLRLSMKKEKHD